MMNGIEIINRAILLLGYNRNQFIDNANEFNIRALDILNNICLDLKLPSVASLNDVIHTSEIKLSAITTGVAMLLSLLIGDSNKNIIFTGLYNAKRAMSLKETGLISDVLPYDDGGVD